MPFISSTIVTVGASTLVSTLGTVSKGTATLASLLNAASNDESTFLSVLRSPAFTASCAFLIDGLSDIKKDVNFAFSAPNSSFSLPSSFHSSKKRLVVDGSCSGGTRRVFEDLLTIASRS